MKNAIFYFLTFTLVSSCFGKSLPCETQMQEDKHLVLAIPSCSRQKSLEHVQEKIAASVMDSLEEDEKWNRLTQFIFTSTSILCDPFFRKRKIVEKVLPIFVGMFNEKNPSPPSPPLTLEIATQSTPAMFQQEPLPMATIDLPAPYWHPQRIEDQNSMRTESPCAPCLTCPACGTWVTSFIPAVQWRYGSGRSYKRGYETVRAFLASYQMGSTFYPFVDLRAHRLGNGRLATNVGLGFRSFTPCADEMFGLNLYYDYRRLHQTNLQQIGVGGELFIKCWEFRVNGYFPIGGKRALRETTTFTFPGGFTSRRDMYDVATWGMDAEVGHPLLTFCCIDFFTAIGSYYYGEGRKGFLGGMWRLGAEYGDCLAASLYVTNDAYFGTKVQGELTLYAPLSCCLNCIRCLFPQVWRNDIILTERFCAFKSNY